MGLDAAILWLNGSRGEDRQSSHRVPFNIWLKRCQPMLTWWLILTVGNRFVHAQKVPPELPSKSCQKFVQDGVSGVNGSGPDEITQSTTDASDRT